jgi:cell division protein FtsW (lipid II flippase)
MLSARNRELLALVPAGLLVTGGFAAIFIQADNRLSAVSLTYGGIFLALCLAGHVVIRRALPNADPYLFPLAAVLASVGIVMIYRINPTLARQQAQWLVVGLAFFSATIVVLRGGRYLELENYRYLIALGGIGCMLLPRLPVIGGQVNGAYLAVHVGGVSFQPSELGKIAIVIFLASYLRDNRQLLVTAGRRVLGVTVPPMKQFGPLLLVWGSAMAMLLLTREIGTSLMFFGAFLAILYVATGRVSFPAVGLVLFAVGAYYLGTHVGHIHARVVAWEHPLRHSLYADGTTYQLANGLFAQADGGLLGVGFGQSLIGLIPVAQSDSIFAVIVNEIGLVGAAGLLLAYDLFIARGLKIALPFVAYGGSSVVMNFVLLALLLLVSDRARQPA